MSNITLKEVTEYIEETLSFEKTLNGLGFFRKREWVGLTKGDIEICEYEDDCPREREDVAREAERILKGKNNG
jgi:hypothetical protein